MIENTELIIQLLVALSLLLYLNQRQLRKQIVQLRSQVAEFVVKEEPQEVTLQEETPVVPKVDFAKRMRSNGKIWQPSLQQQQKALIENMVEDDAEEDEKPAPKPKRKKATASKTTKKKSAKKSQEKPE